MIRKGALLTLTVVTAVMAAAALLVSRQPVGYAGIGERLLPELRRNLNEVARIEIRRTGATVTLQRVDQSWQVVEKGGYPAAADQVRDLLIGMSELVQVEPKTRKVERYAALELQSLDAPGSAATHVSITTDKDRVLANLYIGKVRPGRADPMVTELFVRKADRAQSWLVEGKLKQYGQRPTDWIEKSVLRLDAKRIARVRLQHADGEVIELDRASPQDAAYRLANLNPGEEVKSTYTLGTIATTFSELSIADVAPAAEAVQTPPALLAELHTFDDLRIRLQIWGQGSRNQARLQADGGPAGEADRFNALWSGWVYTLPAYRLDSLDKRRGDLVTSIEDEAA